MPKPTSTATSVQHILEKELERLKAKLGLGSNVRVRHMPGIVEDEKGRRLKERVRGDLIEVYAQDEDEAKVLVGHGLSEWLLEQHSNPYRRFLNKLVELFEDLQYERKERLVEALTKLLREGD